MEEHCAAKRLYHYNQADEKGLRLKTDFLFRHHILWENDINRDTYGGFGKLVQESLSIQLVDGRIPLVLRALGEQAIDMFVVHGLAVLCNSIVSDHDGLTFPAKLYHEFRYSVNCIIDNKDTTHVRMVSVKRVKFS